ncbi:hypothetical protein DFH29DRAFT_1007274 [Suillus ampliporus]|nr:hypothetical protein DFH29DRAFT_1007274 [Suillus ampliporus]
MLDLADCDLPWFKDLDPIWCTNPAFAARTHSSKPDVDHAGELYVLVHSSGGAGPSMKSRNAANAQHSSHKTWAPPSTHGPLPSTQAAMFSAQSPLPDDPFLPDPTHSSSAQHSPHSIPPYGPFD